MPSHEAVRILDASLNRASEGLRVVEDYVRFVLDDAHLTEQLKQLRHDLADVGAALPLPDRHAARDTQRDVGRTVTTRSETERSDPWNVCVASFERVKQSLRSLEEFAKVVSPELGSRFEALRYRLYSLEAAVGRTADATRRLADVRLYVLIDQCESETAFATLIEKLLAGGVDAIQLRAKQLCDRELVARTKQLQAIVRQFPAPSPWRGGMGRGDEAGTRCDHPSLTLPVKGREPEQSEIRRALVIINDRPDIAAVADADGVHLGQDDMSVKDARAIVGPRKLIGVSTHSIDQARAAVLDGANYIGVGPTFPSHTKAFDDFTGVELLKLVAEEIRLPAFAIGGIDSDNVSQVVAAGFTRIAVSSAVTGAEFPAAAAAGLRDALR